MTASDDASSATDAVDAAVAREIEIGRHASAAAPQLDRLQRTCQHCAAGVVEDEPHFLLGCTAWADAGAELTAHMDAALAPLRARPPVGGANGLDALTWWRSLTPDEQVWGAAGRSGRRPGGPPLDASGPQGRARGGRGGL